MTRTQPVLRLENIHKRFGDAEVLKGVSLELFKGDIKVILGPSGSGKSTLLHCINFLVGFEQGIPEQQHQVFFADAMVFCVLGQLLQDPEGECLRGFLVDQDSYPLDQLDEVLVLRVDFRDPGGK